MTVEDADRERLQSPNWPEVERRVGGKPSNALLALYADDELVQRQDFLVEVFSNRRDDVVQEEIIHFLPADAASLAHPWYEYLPKGSFAFAEDIFGDLIFVELEPSGEDGPVRHWYHDGGDIDTISPTLEAFIEACRA